MSTGSTYPAEAIELLTDLVRGKKDNARLLSAAGYPELALISDALNGQQEIMQLLISRRFVVIATFIRAIMTDDRSTIMFLLKQKAAHWAATANAVLNDQGADVWLRRNNLGHYAQLAKAIRDKFDKDEGSGLDLLFRSPIR